MEPLSSQEEEERRMNKEIFGGYNFICFGGPVVLVLGVCQQDPPRIFGKL